MTKLIKEQILMLHSMVIKQTGGLDGVRDNGLLDEMIPERYTEIAIRLIREILLKRI